MPRKTLDLSDGFKTCPDCSVRKPLTEFYKSKQTLHGYAVYCKDCSYERHKKHTAGSAKAKKRRAERARKWRKENPRRSKDCIINRRYNVPYGWYDKTFETQGGRCAICKTTDPGGRGDFHIDHCHSTGETRGLLCHHCNVGIGHLKHDPNILLSAIRYLSESSVERRG